MIAIMNYLHIADSQTKRIRVIENRTYVLYSTWVEEAKRFKSNGKTLPINNEGKMSFSGFVLGKNITDIQENRRKIVVLRCSGCQDWQ